MGSTMFTSIFCLVTLTILSKFLGHMKEESLPIINLTRTYRFTNKKYSKKSETFFVTKWVTIFFTKAQNFTHFPPHDFHEVLPAGHAYTQEGITYNVFVLQHQQDFIGVIDPASEKNQTENALCFERSLTSTTMQIYGIFSP